MVNVIMGLVAFTWLFPPMYLLFGAENVWWVLSLINIAVMIIHLAGLDWVIDKTDIDKDMGKYSGGYYYLYDYTDCYHKGGDE